MRLPPEDCWCCGNLHEASRERRRERSARVWQALQAVAVFGVMWEALTWREDLQEGLWHELRSRGFGA